MMPQPLLSIEHYTQFYEELNRTLEGGLHDCNHTLHFTMELLAVFTSTVRPTLEKIVDLGGHCDCEVLLNADPETYADQFDAEITGPLALGEDEWEAFLQDLEAQSKEE